MTTFLERMKALFFGTKANAPPNAERPLREARSLDNLAHSPIHIKNKIKARLKRSISTGSIRAAVVQEPQVRYNRATRLRNKKILEDLVKRQRH